MSSLHRQPQPQPQPPPAEAELPPHSADPEEELPRVLLALRTVYAPNTAAGPDGAAVPTPFDRRDVADRYLTSFQRAAAAWMVCDRLLSASAVPPPPPPPAEDSPLRTQRQFFAAQTLHAKCLADVHQLPPSSLPSLRDSLLGHFLAHAGEAARAPLEDRPANRPLVTRLGMAIASLAAQMGWATCLTDVANGVLTPHPELGPAVLELFRSVPEEADSNRLVPASEDDLWAYRGVLRNSAHVVLGLCEHAVRSMGGDPGDVATAEAVLSCLQSWVRIVDMDPVLLERTPLLPWVFDLLRDPNRGGFELAVDVVVEMLRTYPSDRKGVEGLVSAIIPRAMALGQADGNSNGQMSPFEKSIKDEDEDGMRGYCRVFTEMAESYLSLILSHEEMNQGSLVELVLRCASVPDREIAGITLHFWYHFVMGLEELEPFQFRQAKIDGFAPQLTRLLGICTHLLRYPVGVEDLSPDRLEDLEGMRLYFADTIEDCCRLLGGEVVLRSAGDPLREECNRVASLPPEKQLADWHGIEAHLFAIQAVSLYIPPDERYCVMGMVMGLIPQLPGEVSLLRATACRTVGRYASWLSRMSAVSVLLPFHQSRRTRHAYLARSQSLLSTAGADDGASAYVLRPLSEKERATLLDPQQCNCRLASDKVDVEVMYRVAGNGEGATMAKWDVSSSLKAQVRNNCFGGRVVLGVLLDGPDSVRETAPSSLRHLVGVSDNGLIQNSVLEPGCSVHRNGEVSDTHAMKYAAVIGCGAVSCSEEDVVKSKKKCNFDLVGGSMDVAVGPEAGGGRVVNVKVESTLVDVCHELKIDPGGKAIAPLMTFEKSDDVESPGTNVLCPHSSLLLTPKTSHVFLAPHASIDSATSVSSSLLLPHSRIKDGCTVSHALLQWNSTITSHSSAHHVFLMERSEVGPHSFTADAIYGPDSHVSGGEVHCTVFGPNANSHHQSLLIGILWPLGRGNVGYGSNVGSNHTGRIPDQETSVGEGTFWGLGSVIKFPVDLTSAPYSIVAAGVQLPPQRIALPFSLITDSPNGMNQLTPGWLLQYSPYTVARSEVKFANRRTAKRHGFYTGWKILRPGVMDLMTVARDRLVRTGNQHQQAGERSSSKKKAVFKTDKAVAGLGANQMTEKGRQIGIRAYTDALQRYALRGLLDQLVELAAQKKNLSARETLCLLGLKGVGGGTLAAADVPVPPASDPEWPVLPWNEPSHADAGALWEHQRLVLLGELPSLLGDGRAHDGNLLSLLLQKCTTLEDDHAKRVYKSKSRDDARGACTVPGYKDVHVAAEKDKVVLAAREEAERVREDAKSVAEALCASGVTTSRL